VANEEVVKNRSLPGDFRLAASLFTAYIGTANRGRRIPAPGHIPQVTAPTAAGSDVEGFMNKLYASLLAVFLACSMLGCGSAHTQPSRTASHGGSAQTGKASWYGKPYHGRTTASGERYNMHAQTAAHKTLPFGTKVRVTNLENGKDTVVRINDRGPFVKGRIIDLSYSAANQIKMVQSGVVSVKVEILSRP
jgi:rare lipoprotein A